MGKMIRSLALDVPLRFFCATSQKNYITSPIILGTHPGYHRLCDLLYFPKGRIFMTDHEERGRAHDVLVQLRIYAIQAFAGLAVFGLFFLTSIGAYLICTIWPEISIMIMIKIVSWLISALGGFCCIALVVRNTIDFIKFLFKVPPRGTCGQEATVEGRTG